jgi:hypothetical protein
VLRVPLCQLEQLVGGELTAPVGVAAPAPTAAPVPAGQPVEPSPTAQPRPRRQTVRNNTDAQLSLIDLTSTD